MAQAYTGGSDTSMSEDQAKKFFKSDLLMLMEKTLNAKELIGGWDGGREISLVHTKLQEGLINSNGLCGN